MPLIIIIIVLRLTGSKGGNPSDWNERALAHVDHHNHQAGPRRSLRRAYEQCSGKGRSLLFFFLLSYTLYPIIQFTALIQGLIVWSAVAFPIKYRQSPRLQGERGRHSAGRNALEHTHMHTHTMLACAGEQLMSYYDY